MPAGPSSTTFTTALDRIADTKVDYLEADLRQLQYAGDRSFSIDDEVSSFSPEAWDTACGYLDIPSDLLPQLRVGLGKLVLKVLHGAGRRAERAPGRLRLACNDEGVVVGMAPSSIGFLTNQQVVSAVMDGWPDHVSSETLSVAKLRVTASEFELVCHTRALTAEPQPGDVLHGGITIRHSQAGTSPTVILSYIHRLVCSNGMTQRVCLQGKPSRTKRTKATNSPTRTLEAIKTQVKQAWAQLDQRLEGLSELLNHPLEVDQLPDGLRRRWSINREVAGEISHALQNDELGRTITEYDLVNAVSRVATHSSHLAPRYARHLSLAAGMFAQRHVHQCPMCGSWLLDKARRPDSAAGG